MGVGKHIDLASRYLLVLFHPVTTEFGNAESQMQEVLDAVKATEEQTIILWPNIDAGSDGVSQAIRRFREFNPDMRLHAYKNFEPDLYIPILARAACAIGNSSTRAVRPKAPALHIQAASARLTAVGRIPAFRPIDWREAFPPKGGRSSQHIAVLAGLISFWWTSQALAVVVSFAFWF
jgi:hypothetical protein